MNKGTVCNITPEADKEFCRKLSDDMQIPYGIAELLCQKGIITSKDATAFLYPQLSHLPSPFLMKDMQAAVDVIMQAIKKQSYILIHGDYDVDGISGTALLANFFNSLNIPTTCYSPNRLLEGYGLQQHIIEKYHPKNENTALLITVDCGISSFDEVQFAKNKGYDVIITDHHEPPDILPEADAILNPKQSECVFPCDELAGVGVAFYFAMAIRSKMVELGTLDKETAPKLKELLGLVAMGTVADVVPLTGVNRILVKAGLEVISKRSIPWTWALCDRAGLREGQVCAGDIAYRLGPRINAPGRLGKPDSAFNLLTSNNTVKASDLADILEKINLERRQIEQESIDEIIEDCSQQDQKGRFGLVAFGNYHPGIIGVIASRIVDMFNKPVIILTEDASGPEVLKGSGRSIKQLNLFEALENCSEALLQHGGHAMAAGMTIKKENLDLFRALFDRVVSEVLHSQEEDISKPEIVADFCVDNEEIFDNTFFHYYQLMEPFGNGNPEPIFLLENQVMLKPGVIHNHLKYSIKLNGRVYKGIGFGMADKLSLVQDYPVNLLFRLKKNVYRGVENIEFHAVDIYASSIKQQYAQI